MVSRYDHKEKEVRHFSVNACMAPLCAVDSLAVTTVEGIGSTRTVLHPCQVSGTPATLVSHGQTLFRTEGKGLGHGHRATCHPGI